MRVPKPIFTIAIVCLAEVGSMSIWFSGSAILDQLQRMWNMSLTPAALITGLVQAGFVAGALFIACFSLSDVYRPSTVFACSALLAAAANGMFALSAVGHPRLALAFRFLSGFFLAGVYPTAMKLVAGWTGKRRGIALGFLVASLTLGSALPHAVRSVGALPWRGVLWTSTLLAATAAIAVALFVTEGPYSAGEVRFDSRKIFELLRNPRARLAYFAYLGHMWELYAMWAWIAVILGASGVRSLQTRSALAFLIIGAGAIGCIVGGHMADTQGDARQRLLSRTRVIRFALAGSSLCCLLTAVAFGHSMAVIFIALVWGICAIADSPQLSTAITELIEPEYVGTALALQTSTGFLLTAISIQVTAMLADSFGWRVAVAAMALGPIFGAVATLRLRRLVRTNAAADQIPVLAEYNR